MGVSSRPTRIQESLRNENIGLQFCCILGVRDWDWSAIQAIGKDPTLSQLSVLPLLKGTLLQIFVNWEIQFVLNKVKLHLLIKASYSHMPGELNMGAHFLLSQG